MSKISLSGNASGTGTLTIAAPNTNTDRTLNLPDSAGTLATAESTLTQFNASGSAPVYACRAWVNFDGTTSPGTIRASGNVSSVVRNGTGDYTINFTTAMPDANYAAVALNGGTATGGPVRAYDDATARSTTAIRFAFLNTSGNFINSVQNAVAIFR